MYYIIIIQLNSHGLLGKLFFFSFIKCVDLFCVFRIGVVWVWFYTCFTCVCGENTPLSQRYRHLIRECPMRWVCNSIGRCKKFIAEDVWVSARLLRCVCECVCLSMRSGIVLLSSLKKFRFDYFSYVLVFLIFHGLLSSIFLVWVRQLIIFTFFSVTCILCDCVILCVKTFFSYPFLRFSYKLLQNEFHWWIFPLFLSLTNYP